MLKILYFLLVWISILPVPKEPRFLEDMISKKTEPKAQPTERGA